MVQPAEKRLITEDRFTPVQGQLNTVESEVDVLQGFQQSATQELDSLDIRVTVLENSGGGGGGGVEVAASVKDYGAVGDGATDDGQAIQDALDGNSRVFFPAGVYVTNRELKIPSNRVVYGQGRDVSIIKGGPLLDRGWNVLTNSENNRQYRTTYNENIYLSDLTVNGNYAGRPAGSQSWDGNASCVFWSTVRNVVVERVKAHDAPLHCFSIDASRLAAAEEGPEFMVPGPSQHVVLRDCQALNSHVDDGITTHYSSEILIENCTSIRTIPLDTGGGTNNGIEIDEGTYRATVRDCYAEGWANGVQVKGHSTTRPAFDILLDRVTCKGNQCSFLLSGTAAYENPTLTGRASNVTFRDCISLSPTDLGSGETVPGSAMKIFAYQNVVVENLITRDAPHGGIVIDRSGQIIIDGVRGEDVWTGTGHTGDGFIRTTGEINDDIIIRNVHILNPISGPIFRNNEESQMRITVENLIASPETTNSFPAISDSYLSTRRAYTGTAWLSGFSKIIEIRGGSGSTSNLESYALYQSKGSGSPEGSVIAWPGHQFISSNASGGFPLWIKATGVGATGWKGVSLV